MDIRFSAITAALAAAVFVSVPASAQVAIQQLGPFTTGHLPMIAGSGFLQDGGGSPGAGQAPQNQNNPGTLPTGLGIVNSGLGYCGFTNYAGTSYGSACWGFDGSGNGLIDFEGIGSVNIKINGQVFPFPGTGSGNVVGPATSTVGHLPLFANTAGTLLSDAGNIIPWLAEVHQNGGGTCYGAGGSHVLCWSDQNMDLIGDHSTIQTQDASLLTYVTLGGTATAGDVVGFDWRVSSVLYQIRYTVQSGDTLSTIAINLSACINAGTAPHCTVTAGFLNALLAFHDANGFGYKPTAGAGGARIAFDQPWAPSGNSVANFLSGGATETMTTTLGDILDLGPYTGTARYVPNRTPVAGDQIGGYIFQGQSTSTSGINTQYAGVFGKVLTQDATNPTGELLLGTSDAITGRNIAPKLAIGNGITFFDNNDASCGYQGLGVVAFCYEQVVYSSHTPQVSWTGVGAELEVIFDQTSPPHASYILYRQNGLGKYQTGLDASANWFLFDKVNGGGVNIIGASSGGTLTLGESSQISIDPTAGAINSLATSPQFTFTTPGAQDNEVVLRAGATGRQVYLQYQDGATKKFGLGLNSSDSFFLADNAHSDALALQLDSAGTLSLGEHAAGGTLLTLGAASAMAIADLPTVAASTGKHFLCIDGTTHLVYEGTGASCN